MPRPALLMLILTLWVLAGCAATQDPFANATELRPGQPYEAKMPGAHYLTFTLDAPSRVVLESETFPGNVGSISPAGVLLDSERQVVARDWTSGRGSNFRIEERLAAGTWYLRVHDPHGCFSGHCQERSYRYRVLLRVDEAP